MALRLEKAFGGNMDLLLNMQASYDIDQARSRAAKIRVKRYPRQAQRLRRTLAICGDYGL